MSNWNVSVFTIVIRGQFGEQLLLGGGLWRRLVLEDCDGWIISVGMDLHAKLSDLFPMDVRDKCFLLIFVDLVLVHVIVVVFASWDVNGGPLGVEELVVMVFKDNISLQSSSIDQLMDDILQALIFFVHVSDQCFLEFFVVLFDVLVERNLTFADDDMGFTLSFDFFAVHNFDQGLSQFDNSRSNKISLILHMNDWDGDVVHLDEALDSAVELSSLFSIE